MHPNVFDGLQTTGWPAAFRILTVRLSLCPSVPYGLVTGRQKSSKIEIGIDVPQGRVKDRWNTCVHAEMYFKTTTTIFICQ